MGSGENCCPPETQIAEPKYFGRVSCAIGILLQSSLHAASWMEMILNEDFTGGSVVVSLSVLREEPSNWFNFPGREQEWGIMVQLS